MTDPSLGVSSPLASPIFPSSVYRLPDLDALDRIVEGQEPGFIYARDGHPNARGLESSLAELERGTWAVAAGSGMAAISAACLSILRAGDRIVASDQLYGRTSNLIKDQLPRFGVTSATVDINDLDQVSESLQSPTRLLVVETISNPLLRVANIPELAELAHRHSCLLLVDNTFATPVLFRPLENGADVVMESLGKMIGGHSDITLGALSGRDEALHSGIAAAVSAWGLSPPQLECWLAQRSLPTLELRMRAATANAAQLAQSLQGHSNLARVIYPGLVSHPDHALATKLLPQGCGNILSIELKGSGREAVNRFIQRASGIPFCPSLGDVSTTCSHPATTSHRYHSAEEKKRQGITDELIRLSIGIEPVDQILREIEKGLGA